VIDANVPNTFGTFAKMQVAQATHTLTTADIAQGYAVTPIVWPVPWPDANYMITSGILSSLADGDFTVGAAHQITPTGCNITTVLNSAGTLVQGLFDAVNSVVGDTFSFQPLVNNVYKVSVVMIGTATSPSPFSGSAVQASLTYDDTFGAQSLVLNSVTTNDGPSGVTYPVFATTAAPMVITTAFTTYAIAGQVLTTSSFVSGAFSGTAMPYGTTMTQATSGATAEFYGSFNNGGLAMVYRVLTGTDGGQEWTSGTAHFTPSGSPTPTTGLFGASGGVLQQAVTGATASELSLLVGTGTEYVGPGITGGTADATHAWIDLVSGGVLIPSATPVLQTFSYNLHIRIEATPLNGNIYTAGQQFIVDAFSAHA
jgi:hypothetical protein